MSAAEAPTHAATEFATSADGTPIAFERSGSGPAVVLVDGALCSREFGPGREVAAALADRFTVLVYDRRGRGESGCATPSSPLREFEDLAAVLDAAGGDAAVMGQSSGAALAYRAAAAGIPMRAVAGYEAPWVGLRTARDGTRRDYLAELEALLAAGRRGAAVDYFMTKMVRGPWFLPLVMRAMRTVWSQLQAVAPTLPDDARMMGAAFTPPLEELAGIRIPALVLVGGKADADMTAAQRAVADAIPGARHAVLAGQTHQVSPAVLAPALADFFADHSSSSEAP